MMGLSASMLPVMKYSLPEITSTPKVLSFEMPGFSYAHPSLSADGNTLYFASDVSGGYGGMDLYVTHRNGNAWESAVNLGPVVNTSGNEIFPFIAADSSLYFTSDGHPGYGGLDLFHSKFKEGKFAKPDNMGVDFNSAKDDLSMIVDTKNRTGYFASNRDGDDDIFSFRLPAKKMDSKDMEKMPAEGWRTGTVVDKTNNRPISGARVEISKPSNPMSGMYYYTNDSGMFHFARKIDADDQIKVAKDGYKLNSFYGSNVADAKSFEVSMDSGAVVSNNARIDFTSLYYDVNKSNLTSSMMESLRPVIDVMKSSPGSHVYVSGYADERGGETYNFGLSLRRVKEVTDYLSSQGIDMQKVHSAFFGAVQLSTQCRKDPKCVVNTDRENRRVEVYVSNK
jgi:outer membrane protein OmpA-like peptidoglycan-associated protein